MSAAHQEIMPWGLIYEMRRLAGAGDEVVTPPEDEMGEMGAGMDVEGGMGGMLGDDNGGVASGLSSPPPGEDEDAGMDVE